VSTTNPWLRLLANVAGWAFATFCAFAFLDDTHDALQIMVLAVLFIVWPALIYWVCVPKASSVRGQIVRLVLYLAAMTSIGLVALGLGVLTSICLFGFKWRM
jgi:hypothetical protein